MYFRNEHQKFFLCTVKSFDHVVDDVFLRRERERERDPLSPLRLPLQNRHMCVHSLVWNNDYYIFSPPPQPSLVDH